MPYPKAILFDLDDTIITEGDRATIVLETAEEFAEAFSPHNAIDVADHIEAALNDFWALSPVGRSMRLGSEQWSIRQSREKVISDTLRTIGVNGSSDLTIRFCDRFERLRSLAGREYPGARTTIETLKRVGVKLALVTNGPADYQRAKIERFSLAPLFDHIQIEGEHGFGKPDEKAYLHAMSALGVSPHETWMVGDNLEWEVVAPQRLGIYAVWHDHRGTGLPSNSVVRPDKIVRQLSELLMQI